MKKRKFHYFLLIFLIFSMTASIANSEKTSLPKAEIHEVEDTYFGTVIKDPYRWMENGKSKEMQAWIKGQSDYANAYLKSLPMRDEIYKRLVEVSQAGDTVSEIVKNGNNFFYIRRNSNEKDFKLYVREGLTGTERLLVDPNKVINDGKRYSLNGWNVSIDGKYVSYNIAEGGSEQGEIHVVDVITGKDLGEKIDRINFTNNANDNWLPDGKSFLYSRIRKLDDKSDETEKYKKIKIYRHVLGSDPDDDDEIFGYGVNKDINIDEDSYPDVWVNNHEGYVFVMLNAGTSPEMEIHAALIDDFVSNKPIVWRKIVGFDDKVSWFDVHNDDLYLVTSKDAPQYKVIRTSFLNPNVKEAELIFADNNLIIQDIFTQPDALYANTTKGGVGVIQRIDYKTKKAESIVLPYTGSALVSSSEKNMDGIYYNIISWTKSDAHFKFDPKTKQSIPTNLRPVSSVDMSDVEVVNAEAKSYDGTKIPLVLLYKKGLQRNEKNPVFMDGYGAYGFDNTSPFFYPSMLPWLEHGGVYVLTGVRGGGEYGESWHEAGLKNTKANTWKDFIACAEFLISEKYTSPSHLAIFGASAGGVLISNSIAERPDLFKAAVIDVGMSNVLRSETTANGVPNIAEFGSVKTEKGFKDLLAMDGYLKIKDGVNYPAVLLTHGINDPRVEFWMSAKMTARLQAASVSNKPILLSVDYDAGHGYGSTEIQKNKARADRFSFLLQQVGKK